MTSGIPEVITRGKLSDGVQEQILDIIMSGDYDNDGFIPSEGELCKRFNVSRVTVREAVRALEVRGFVERIHGKGIRIIDRSVQVVARSLNDMLNRNSTDLTALLEVRKIFELQASRLAAMRADEEDIKEMAEVLSKMGNPNTSFDEYIQEDLNFHNLIVKASKNKILEAIVNALQPLLKECILMSTKSDDRPEINMKYHRKVYNCIVAHDPDGAYDHMIEHLKATEELLNSK